VLSAYKKLRKKCKNIDIKDVPQLVIVGNSSIDDPDGVPIYNLTMEKVSENLNKYSDDIKVVRLPHIDQLLNTLLRESLISLQLSHREGFEVKVTESLMKAIPMIAYKAGGIPLQIDDGESGFLVEIGNTRKVAQKAYLLITNKRKYKSMSRKAKRKVHPDVNTVSNAINWLFLANELARNGKYIGNGEYIKDLIK
jgi:glycosyltransferase involved in cell wall biosynthesis